MVSDAFGKHANARFFQRPSAEVAPDLLNCVFVTRISGAVVAIRLTEVEAYGGVGEDPGSHSFRGQTPRNESMFKTGGHLYVYRSYGIHWCVNMVCGQEGSSAGVLLRAGEVIQGADIALARRTVTGTVRADRDLARGPGRLGSAMGITKALDGIALAPNGEASLYLGQPTTYLTSTRTGVAGAGAPLIARYYLADDPTVSPHKPVIARN